MIFAALPGPERLQARLRMIKVELVNKSGENRRFILASNYPMDDYLAGGIFILLLFGFTRFEVKPGNDDCSN